MLATLFYVIIGIPIVFISLHTIVRVIRYFYKFPMPEFLANLIDNPLRRKIQPPSEMPIRHGIQPGMTVLEVGPGNGRYTIETARKVGNTGKVIAIDIEPKMIERVVNRAHQEGITNLEAKVANVYKLPFSDNEFDAIDMITVMSEIPNPVQAMNEFYRVLKSTGILSFSELITDPDYPLEKTLIRLARKAKFKLRNRLGNFIAYTVVFEKQ